MHFSIYARRCLPPVPARLSFVPPAPTYILLLYIHIPDLLLYHTDGGAVLLSTFPLADLPTCCSSLYSCPIPCLLGALFASSAWWAPRRHFGFLRRPPHRAHLPPALLHFLRHGGDGMVPWAFAACLCRAAPWRTFLPTSVVPAADLFYLYPRARRRAAILLFLRDTVVGQVFPPVFLAVMVEFLVVFRARLPISYTELVQYSAPPPSRRHAGRRSHLPPALSGRTISTCRPHSCMSSAVWFAGLPSSCSTRHSVDARAWCLRSHTYYPCRPCARPRLPQQLFRRRLPAPTLPYISSIFLLVPPYDRIGVLHSSTRVVSSCRGFPYRRLLAFLLPWTNIYSVRAAVPSADERAGGPAAGPALFLLPADVGRRPPPRPACGVIGRACFSAPFLPCSHLPSPRARHSPTCSHFSPPARPAAGGCGRAWRGGGGGDRRARAGFLRGHLMVISSPSPRPRPSSADRTAAARGRAVMACLLPAAPGAVLPCPPVPSGIPCTPSRAFRACVSPVSFLGFLLLAYLLFFAWPYVSILRRQPVACCRARAARASSMNHISPTFFLARVSHGMAAPHAACAPHS